MRFKRSLGSTSTWTTLALMRVSCGEYDDRTSIARIAHLTDGHFCLLSDSERFRTILVFQSAAFQFVLLIRRVATCRSPLHRISTLHNLADCYSREVFLSTPSRTLTCPKLKKMTKENKIFAVSFFHSYHFQDLCFLHFANDCK